MRLKKIFIIIGLVILDIIKLPISIIVVPISLFVAFFEYIHDNKHWVDDWIIFNKEFMLLFILRINYVLYIINKQHKYKI